MSNSQTPNFQNLGNLMTIFTILTVVGYIVLWSGMGVQSSAQNQILANSDNIVSCEKNKLKHLKGENASLRNGYRMKITGYSTITISLLFIVLITFMNQCYYFLPKSAGGHMLCDTAINCKLPGIATLGVVTYRLALYFNYAKRLQLNKVASEYFYYSNIFGLLSFIQIFIFIKFVFDKFVTCSGRKNERSYMSFLIYLLTILNLLLLGITNVILKYYSTDG
mgnify:CR=1 FL=1